MDADNSKSHADAHNDIFERRLTSLEPEDARYRSTARGVRFLRERKMVRVNPCFAAQVCFSVNPILLAGASQAGLACTCADHQAHFVFYAPHRFWVSATCSSHVCAVVQILHLMHSILRYRHLLESFPESCLRCDVAFVKSILEHVGTDLFIQASAFWPNSSRKEAIHR